MGLIDLIFGRKPKKETQGSGFQTVTAYQPAFTTWGGQIYESELVRAAIDAKARHAAKLMYSMRGAARPSLLTATKSAPNPWMTWAKFMERCSNIYEVQNNLFIVPTTNEYGDVTGYFPVLPSSCELIEAGGQAMVKFRLQNQTRVIRLEKMAIITKHQYRDDFFGEKNTALNATMELINMVNQGIEEGVKNAATFRFMAQLVTPAFDEDLAKEQERFNKNNMARGAGGLLLYGNQMQNMQQIKQEQYKVDADQMKMIQTNVYNYFGVSEPILQNSATGDQMDSFFNGCIEPFAIKMSEGISRMVFTQRELNNGNRVTFTANRLQYMSVSSKVSMAKELGDRGILMIDEIRELFNYDPLPDGAGQHAPIRGEYYMVDEGRDGDKDDGGTGDKDGQDDARMRIPGNRVRLIPAERVMGRIPAAKEAREDKPGAEAAGAEG